MIDQQAIAEPDQQIEGIGNPEDPKDPEDKSLDDPPLDTTLIRTESRTIFEVLRRIGQDNYIMDPDFQRDFIWDERKQSKLIESVLMRIPLPVFYIAENEDGRVVVVDGLQRLSTFRHFVEGVCVFVFQINLSLTANGSRTFRLSSKTGLRTSTFRCTSSMRKHRSKRGSIFSSGSTAGLPYLASKCAIAFT